MNRTEKGEVMVIPVDLNRDVEEIVIDDIANLTGTRGLRVSVVNFPPGSRRPKSSHNQDQYIWPLSGRGVLITQMESWTSNPAVWYSFPLASRISTGPPRGAASRSFQ